MSTNNYYDHEKIKMLKQRLPSKYLKRAKKRGYICPVCGSGTGSKGTGLETKDNIHFTCFAGDCFKNADILDIIGRVEGLGDTKNNYKEIVKKAIELNGDSEDYYKNTNYIDDKGVIEIEPIKKADTGDYSNYFIKTSYRINETEYHRGLSLETLQKYNIGYDPNWKHPKKPTLPATPRLIIPTGDSNKSYLARSTNNDGDYSKIKVGESSLFNSKILKQLDITKPLIVAEGEIDALSLLECGLTQVIGLGSTSNKNLLLQALKALTPKTTPPILIALDNDEAGQKGADTLLRELQPLNIEVFIYPLAIGNKDINEKLIQDRKGLEAEIKPLLDDVEAVLTALRNSKNAEAKEVLNKINATAGVDELLQQIENGTSYNAIETGFSRLDNYVLEGGLYNGLYVLGALSSLGKTTFCLQVAEQIARAGTDVIFFSLEMSRIELLAKLISKQTYIQADLNKSIAKTTTGILNSSRYSKYSKQELAHIEQCCNKVKELDNLYIVEGMGNIGVAEVKRRVKQHIDVTGNNPVVFIDYLQILSPVDIKATDKQNTDIAVIELKRMSRDYKIPVIAISSFNRENYNNPVNMSSFKESGAIEYSSDVLIGLQYKGMDDKLKDKNSNEKINIDQLRKYNEKRGKHGKSILVELKVLKNRNGSKGYCDFEFIPMFNIYIEATNQNNLIVDLKDTGEEESVKALFDDLDSSSSNKTDINDIFS